MEKQVDKPDMLLSKKVAAPGGESWYSVLSFF